MRTPLPLGRCRFIHTVRGVYASCTIQRRDTRQLVFQVRNEYRVSICMASNNYRGISLLSIVGKVFARVILMRLQKLAERIYPETQCGFRAGRSTIYIFFSLRQLQEKCKEQHMPLYIAFIELTNAFNLSPETASLRFSQRSVSHPHGRA